jgi:hypothetical protein
MNLSRFGKQLRFFLVVAGLALLTAGCSTFNREWKSTVAASLPTNDIQGPWQGSWHSTANGHEDQLRCIIKTRSDGLYDARFDARYKKIFTFDYTARLNVQRTNNQFQFQGAADLGWWAGGAYHYKGEASPTNFPSVYESKYDHGTFQMQRPDGNAKLVR